MAGDVPSTPPDAAAATAAAMWERRWCGWVCPFSGSWERDRVWFVALVADVAAVAVVTVAAAAAAAAAVAASPALPASVPLVGPAFFTKTGREVTTPQF